jgi:hypothetical protein
VAKFIDFSAYNKHQVILTSDRLILNAKSDNLFLLAKKDIAMSMGGDLHINVGPKDSKTAKMIVNAPIVQFGVGNDLQGVAKADSAVQSLNDIVTELSNFMRALVPAKGLVSGGVATLPAINMAADAFLKKLPDIQKNLDNIKSSVTFTN